ncbi:MAG TPA: alpha/beta hydrolase [Xanthobacteraceae bacterium]|nr:alpha/beta hydrolase [Xanthobacteraceae bacterium]
MKVRIAFAALGALVTASSPSWGQVPPDIAEGIRKIGHVVDTPATAKLYTPLFAEQKEPYANVKVTRDVAYGPDAANKLDVFTSGIGTGKTVVVYVHGGGFERGDKRPAGSPFYDNIMLWLTQHGMVGVNMNYRLAPKNVWPAAHEDMAAVVRWVQQNIAQYGGDPGHLALWGQSAGASLIAGYLAHPQFWGPNGHGIKAAVMNSGFYENDRGGSAYFGSDPKELAERSSTEGLKKVTIPLFISHTEVDLPDAIREADAANKALCEAGRCPIYAVFKDHSHISQGYSVGTMDTSVSGPILKVLSEIK